MQVPGPPASELFGREPERSRVEAFAEAVPQGLRSLLIRGGSGIGKTALWRFGVQRCRDLGYRVLVTRPAEEEMPLALVGLVDLVEDVPIDQEALRAEDPFARGRAVLDAIRGTIERGPIVIAIDDLQWLDAMSANALRYAFRRLEADPVGVLATMRLDADTVDPLGISTVLPPQRSDRCDLGPLDEAALRRVLSGVVRSISRPALRRIHEVSGGNPLYALELARGLTRGNGSGRTEALSLPGSLTGAIAERLDSLPDELIPVHEAVAALGRATVPQLSDLFPETDLEELLAAAAFHGLLVVEPDLQVRFAHPLFGSAVYGRMRPLARRSLHARLAELSSDPDARARHLALSTDGPDEATAALLEEAARRSSQRGASDLAADFARHSVRLTDARDADARRRRTLAQISYLASAGEVHRALALADELVQALPPGRDRAEALVERARLEDDDLQKNDELLSHALEEAGDDERLRGQVLDQLGWMRGMFRGDLAGGIADEREALEIARRLGDRELEMWASAGVAHLELNAGVPRPELVERAVALEQEIGQPLLWAGPRVQLATFRRFAGDLEGARALYEQTFAEAVRSGNERWRPHGLYNLAGLECHGGNFVRADQLLDEAIAAARDAEDTHVEGWISHMRALTATWLGRADEARAIVDRILEWAERRGERPAIVRAQALLGLLALSEGRADAAVRELVESTRRLEEMGIRHPAAIPAVPDAVEALAAAGDLASAGAMLERLEADARLMESRWVDAVTERARGMLALGRGRSDLAADMEARAAGAFDELGFAADAARAVLGRGRALLRDGQRSQAAEVLADARDRFAKMGARLWEARAIEELERVAPGRAAGELTPTEARVAQLIAEGMRNKEIGAALFISVATVEAHLTRIYRKLGIRSRTELARLVVDGELDLAAPAEGAPPEPS